MRPSAFLLHQQLRQTFRRTFTPIPVLGDASLETFRTQAFAPAEPVLLPKGTFAELPAIVKWFRHLPSDEGGGKGRKAAFNTTYLLAPPAQADYTHLPTEFTDLSTQTFHRTAAPLSLFLQWASSSQSQSQTPQQRLTISQSPLSLLPPTLQADLHPTPTYILHAGRGDIYADSLWLGLAPTATPLHSDPNPNLLVQLAGQKVVRMLPPREGRQVWEGVAQRRAATATGPLVEGGEGMMIGEGRRGLEVAVWGDDHISQTSSPTLTPEEEGQGEEVEGWEATLEPGDGLFIPKGWWHAVRGVGVAGGVSASVNWWFR